MMDSVSRRVEADLAGRIHGQVAVLAHVHGASLRLQIPLMDGAAAERALDDDVRLRETLLNVASLELHSSRDVARPVGRPAGELPRIKVIVDQRRLRPNGAFNVNDRLDWLVLHLNKRGGLLGNRCVVRGDGGNGLPVVEDAVLRHLHPPLVTRRHRYLAANGLVAHGDIREIGGRDDSPYARHGRGL